MEPHELDKVINRLIVPSIEKLRKYPKVIESKYLDSDLITTLMTAFLLKQRDSMKDSELKKQFLAIYEEFEKYRSRANNGSQKVPEEQEKDKIFKKLFASGKNQAEISYLQYTHFPNLKSCLERILFVSKYKIEQAASYKIMKNEAGEVYPTPCKLQ